MPKKTFFHLPQVKRERIENAALDEFATHGYDASHVNRIIERAVIAKGSFYQYFEDKQDLYHYIVQCLMKKKMSYLAPVLESIEEMTFFEGLRALYSEGMRFCVENPRAVSIGLQMFSNKNHPVHQAIMGKNRKTVDELFVPLLQRAADRHEIRQDVDFHLAASWILALNQNIVDFSMAHADTNDRWITNMNKLIEQTITFLQHGLSTKGE